MVDELPDLVGPHGDEPLVAPVLAVLLLEDDARDAPLLPLLRGGARARGGARDREYGLVVLRVGPGEPLEVREGGGLVEGGGGERGGRLRVVAVAVAEAEGLGEHGATEEHACWPLRVRQRNGGAMEKTMAQRVLGRVCDHCGPFD